jgi:hypothetical protein
LSFAAQQNGSARPPGSTEFVQAATRKHSKPIARFLEYSLFLSYHYSYCRKMFNKRTAPQLEEQKEAQPSCTTGLPEVHDEGGQPAYLSGWKLHVVTFWLVISLFVAQMDTSITSTAIVKITDRLGDYEKNSWVFTAYLLTFCGQYVELVPMRLAKILQAFR